MFKQSAYMQTRQSGQHYRNGQQIDFV